MKEKKPEFPSLVEQGKNLAKSVKNVAKDAIKGGPVVAPFEVVKKRLKTCKKCEYYYESATDQKFDRCSACGCVIIAKTNLASSECPKGKWGKWESE
jgi:hypothetical protein